MKKNNVVVLRPNKKEISLEISKQMGLDVNESIVKEKYLEFDYRFHVELAFQQELYINYLENKEN